MQNFKLGTFRGIPIDLNPSLFFIFGLLSLSLAVGYLPDEYPTLSPSAIWIIALFTSVCFVASILLHELGHAWLARRNGIPVAGITLFIFGGVARLEREPKSAGAEFRIAVAGPLVSFALAGTFAAIWLLDRQFAQLAAPSLWLARINLALAVFNLLPGFPLDGGRIFRAFIWQVTGNFHKATRWASMTGQVAALGLIGVGVYLMVQGGVLNGIWLVFIGLFLRNAAAMAGVVGQTRAMLEGVFVGHAMISQPVVVAARDRLNKVFQEDLYPRGQSVALVQEGDAPRGLISLEQIMDIPREKWPWTQAWDAMTPWSRVVQLEPGLDLVEAWERLDSVAASEAAVVDKGMIVGVLTRERIARALEYRARMANRPANSANRPAS